jgi:CheY-like chemotaxis protein
MSSDSATALVAGGDVGRRVRLAGLLRAAGLHVVEAETGSGVLARLAVAPVDIVFVDVELPDTSGYEICEKIKSDRQYAGIPVVQVASADMADRIRGASGGADGYLVEPVEGDELTTVTEELLRAPHGRRDTELLAWRLSRLAEVTVAINAAVTLPGMLAAAAAGAHRMWGWPVVVSAASADGVRLAAVAAADGGQPAIGECALELPDVPVGVSQRHASPADWPLVEWPDDDEVLVVAARLRLDRAPVFVAVPVSRPNPGAPVMNQMAQAIAGAVESQRSYDEEHRIARTLQRSLLQRRLPSVNGLDLAVRYSPASAWTEVGGDFYELTALDHGLLVAVGDVAGHSLHAATVMAELRHAVRAYALDALHPGDVMERVSRLMRRLLPDEVATLCLMLLDPATGRVRLASAGHPPPLLISPGGTRFVEVRGPLLGVDVARPPDLEFVIPRGSTLVTYTDGLIERRDREIDAGFRALAQCAATVDAELDRFCDRLLMNLGGAGSEDDIAVVAVRRR